MDGMMPMTRLEVAASIIGLAGALAGLLWLWIEHRGRTVFASRDDLAGVEEKVGKMDVSHVATKVLAQGNERRISLLEQASANQAERMSELVVKPLGEITRVLQQHGEILASHKSDMRSIGRSLDELKDNMREMKKDHSP
jgi:hypothetical protein